MAVTPAFDRAIPAPSDASFTNGERAIAVDTVIGDEAVGTYYLAKFFNLPPGVYNIKLLMSPGGSFLFNGITLSGGSLITTQIDVPAGNHRIDLILNKSSAGQKLFAAFLIFRADKVIYASAGSGWVWSTSGITDGSVPAAADPRLSLPVFGVQPNWADGITERVSYLTDVLTSETGAEQRRALREFPRRSFEMGFLRKGDMRARLDAFLTGVGRSDFMFPLWQEQYRSVIGLGVGEAYQQFSGDNLSLREFTADDLVLVTNGDPRAQEVLIVQTVDTSNNRLVWRNPPTKNWPVGTKLVPLRRAYLGDSATLDNPTDRVGTVQLRFEMKDPEKSFVPDWGYCAPLWRFRIDRGTSVALTYDRTSFTMDSDTGPVIVTDPGQQASIASRFAVMTRGRQELRMLRSFMAASRGRAVRFYAPSFTHDLEPVADLGGVSFDIKSIDFSELMPYPQWARKIIAVVFNDGSPTIYRTVVGVSEQVSFGGLVVDRFVLDEELPSISLLNVERVQFVVPSRFDQDAFEFKHHVDQAAAVTATFMTRSVDGTGMPPIECYSTSRPYPLEAGDNLNVSLLPTEGALITMPKPLDELDVSMTPISGVLEILLVTTSTGESIDVSMTPLSGTLVTNLVTLEPIVEGLDTIMTPTSGTLQSILITYGDYTPEGLDVSMAPTGGQLADGYTWDSLDVGWDDTEAAWDDLNES